ncbi:uncharacterized protein LOC111910511 [Lactuca sativa]|uniref:uncharacterized protein LOC111910511 n=1 Tax=Lactuca sativa TaxID=4236 RepID=UPI000CD84B58|nr:uncharacterized protein LOC111910511 [Lactuca sativa]
MQIVNSVGSPTRSPLLFVEEYDHWNVRMERFSIAKDRGEEIWRSVKEGPHVPVRIVVRDAAAQVMAQYETLLTADDIEKLHVDQVTFSEMVFGVPPSLFENIKLCKLAKEIWDTLQDLIDASKNKKEKHLTSVVNDFDTFTTTPGESVALASNPYQIVVNNMAAHGIGDLGQKMKMMLLNLTIATWPPVIHLVEASFNRSNHTNNCVVEEIISVTIETDTSEFVWASLHDKVEKSSCVSSDSCESVSLVVSKTKLVPITLEFSNPSVGQTSKSVSQPKRKPMLNRKDIVDPKVEAGSAHKKEVKTTQNSKFTENSKPSVSRNSHASTHSQHSFAPSKILKRPSESLSRGEHKNLVSSTQPKSRLNAMTVQNTSPRTVSSVFIAKSYSTILKPNISKSNVSSKKYTNVKKTNFLKSSKKNLVWKVKSLIDETTILEDTTDSNTPEVKGPKKTVRNPQVIEYDYWIDEKTLAFCLFPKSSKNTT